MNIKLNIIKTEIARIIKNCSNIKDSYKDLNDIKNGFISKGYPEHIVSSIIFAILQKAESGQNKTTNLKSKKKTKMINTFYYKSHI